MILAFTGTRRGLTPIQRAALPSVLAALPERVLHGGAIGADEEFHYWLRKLVECPAIEIYPGKYERWEFWRRQEYGSLWGNCPPGSAIIYSHDEPLIRNKVMAQRCDALLAGPATAAEELRSGTWATVRYARKAGKLITIINPDGSVVGERP